MNQFIKRNEGRLIGYGFAAAAIVGGVLYIKGRKNRERKDAVKEGDKIKKSLVTKKVKTAKGITTVTYNPRVVAKQFGLDFGFAYPSYDPRRWTENDSAVRDALLKIPKEFVTDVSKNYADLYSRDLESDAQRYLPEKDWAKVQNVFQ